MAARFFVVLITAPRGRKAEALARALVSARLAACVNAVPGVVSHYRWKGKSVRDAETLLIVKTSRAKLPALTRFVEKNHPYTTPEVLALDASGGSKGYLAWLAGELR